jgi:hypothetical protein
MRDNEQEMIEDEEGETLKNDMPRQHRFESCKLRRL